MTSVVRHTRAMRRARPVVVTDMREPIALVHRRLIRRRTVLMVVWIIGWAATGFVADRGWVPIAILVVTGPLLWLVVWCATERSRHGARIAPAVALPPGPTSDGFHTGGSAGTPPP